MEMRGDLAKIRVFDWHLPAGKGNHLASVRHVEVIQIGALHRGRSRSRCGEDRGARGELAAEE